MMNPLLKLDSKNLHIWLLSYFSRNLPVAARRQTPDPAKPIHIYFCFVDHFEPKWKRPPCDQERKRVDTWVEKYPRMAEKHRDSEGKHPQHVFFYPEEEYEEEHLNKLAGLCKQGYGDVEIHLHHRNDTSSSLQKKLHDFKCLLHEKHGLLRRDPDTGEIIYAFIHGMWALDNSRRDGDWCGVNNELTVLRDTGCYADFTLPSAPSDTQTRKINSIYYATDVPEKPKSHNTGIDVKKGCPPCGDLMIVQGPLALNWKFRKYHVFPRIENAEVSARNYPTKQRVDLWIKQHISLPGEPNKIFVKVHSHGAQEQNFNALLCGPRNDMHDYLESKYNDGKNYVLHYVTTWEMYREIKRIESDNCVQPFSKGR